MDATTAGSAAALILSKLQPPALRPGIVRRSALLDRLMRDGGPPLVSIVAPGGYGKTTLLAQWAEECHRGFAWLTVDRDDNDLALLVREIEAALLAAGVLCADDATPPRGTAVNRLRAAVSSSTRPFVLVLDDAHLLTAPDVTDFLAALVRSVPYGSQLVLSGRDEVVYVVAAARASRNVLEISADCLALDEREAHALLEGLHPSFTGKLAESYVRRAEGWAAGLYLLALTRSEAVSEGDTERYVADYLWTQHLAALPEDEIRFLVETSVLDRLSAPLCDAALDRDDSVAMLERIAISTPFLVPLDRHGEWYRYHDLLRDALQRRHESDGSGSPSDVLQRAADWCLANDLPDAAMRHAAAAGDEARMARIFVLHGFGLYRTGRIATLESWLDMLDDGPFLARNPAVAALGGLAQAMLERPFQAERWVDVALRNATEAPSPPDGSASVIAWARAVNALMCREGPERALEDAEAALADLAPFSPFLGPATAFRAAALELLGRPEAEDALADAAEIAQATGAPFAVVYAFCSLTHYALERGDLAAAEAACAHYLPLLESNAFVDYKLLALPLAVAARVRLAQGDLDEAWRLLAAFQRIRPVLTHALPFINVRALVEAARAYLALGDSGAARAVLVDADGIVRHRPALGTLRDELAALHEQASTTRASAPGWEHSLTAAELRLLPLLTTHLSFREIGERLFVSRNTVKTQAISIYRKLGASSRGEAVERAAELGLIDRDQVVRR